MGPFLPGLATRLLADARVSAPRIILLGAMVAALALLVEPALGQQPVADSVVSFTGEVRTRGEYDRPGSGLGGDGFTMLRSRFGVRARLGDGARMFVQLQDSRMFGQQGSTTAGSADQLDLHQGYLELAGAWNERDLALRVGRQEIVVGNERLIGAANWTSTGRSFDGARVDLTPAGAAWKATAFAATLAERGRRSALGGEARGDDKLLGVAVGRGGLEALLAHDRGVHFRSYDDVSRTTAYARYRTPKVLGGVSLDLEGAYQLGDQRRATGVGTTTAAQDVRAWFAGVRLERAATDALPASFNLGLDWLSGDDDPTDRSYGAFNTLYATNHKWYGSMDLFLDPSARTRERGLVDVMAGTAVRLSPRATLRADVHHFRTAARGQPLPGGAAPDRALGWEADLTLPLQLTRTAGLELGYALFTPRAGGEAMGLGNDGSVRHWSYAQLRVGF